MEGPLISHHRRPLPPEHVAFGALEGRRMLAEALAAGDAEAFFPLIAHFHTQAEPAWCGFGTLVTVLNALEIDPGRTWKGPWRFFGEELLVCCKALEVAADEGLSLAEVGCLAACNGARAHLSHAEGEEAEFRRAVLESVRQPGGRFVVANYHRGLLGQTGTGHFSPLAAWHEASDRVLVLDVARFKYPPHWVELSALWRAMQAIDESSGRARGYLVLERAEQAELPADAERLVDRLRGMGLPMCPPPLSPPAPSTVRG